MAEIKRNEVIYCGLCNIETHKVTTESNTFSCPQCESVFERVVFTPPSTPKAVWLLKTPGPGVVRPEQKQGEVIPLERGAFLGHVPRETVDTLLPGADYLSFTKTLSTDTERFLQQVFHPGRLESTRDCLDRAVKLLELWHFLSQEKIRLSQKQF